jgi:hypothetical protein
MLLRTKVSYPDIQIAICFRLMSDLLIERSVVFSEIWIGLCLWNVQRSKPYTLKAQLFGTEGIDPTSASGDRGVGIVYY